MRKWSRWARIVWLLLLLGALVPIFSAATDLASVTAGRLPGDHDTAFARITGQSWGTFAASNPSVSHYIRALEAGYAVHELTYGIMLALIVGFWLRPHRPAAWATCWAVVVADVGYLVTFGTADAALTVRGVAVIAVTVVLLALIARPALSPAKHRIAAM